MSYIHFKSVYNKNYDKVTFDTVSLSIGQLKKLIIEKSKFTKQLDFDLEITNADTNEVYKNEGDVVMKNARVHVKRIMKNSTMPLRAQPPKTVAPPPVQNTAASDAAASFSLTQTQSKPAAQQPPQVTIPKPAAPPVLVPPTQVAIQQPPPPPQPIAQSQPPQPVIVPTQSQMTHSVSASNLQQQAQVTQASISKSAYDSLAPLDLPSKPILYGQENHQKAELELSQINLLGTEQQTAAKIEDSRQDEKAKLESILLSSMNSQSQLGGGPSMKTSQYSTNNTMLIQQHLNNTTAGDTSTTGTMSAQTIMQQQQQNRFTGGQWPPRMPLGQHRPLPATYRCGICKKPGHLKNLCPDAGSYVKPEERPKFPSGIPRNKMRPAEAGDKFSMLGPDGYVVPIIEFQVSHVVKKDKIAFLTEEEEEEEKKRLGTDTNQPQANMTVKYPPELKCPFGDHIIKDAVLVPCCGHFICCDECIREKISSDECVECPHEDCDQEIGSLESITPYHNIRRMVNEYLNEMKLANQKCAKDASQSKSSASSDPFLESLLDDVEVKVGKEVPKGEFDYDDLLKSEPGKDDDGQRESSGTESPLQDNNISSSVAQLQASLAQNLLKKGDINEPGKSGIIQPALLPTPPLAISDTNGSNRSTPPVAAASPPVIPSQQQQQQLVNNLPPLARPMDVPNNPLANPQMQQQQQGNFGINRMTMINHSNFNYNQQGIRAPGMSIPMQGQQPFQKPPQMPQNRPMMIQQQHFQQQQQTQMQFQNQMMVRPMGQNGYVQPINQFPMQQKPPHFGMNQFQQQQQFGMQQTQGNFMQNPHGAPGMNMPPIIGAGAGSNMPNLPGQQMYNQVPKIGMVNQTSSSSMAAKPPVMSEAEFYRLKEQLNRGHNEPPSMYRGSKYRRRSRSGSRYTSTSRSYSKSKSKSPSNRRRHRSRSSYSRSRSRSSSRSDNRRHHRQQTKSKRYSRSRTRSPASTRYHPSNNKPSTHRGGSMSKSSSSNYRGSSMSKSSSNYQGDKYSRASNGYRRKSRSRSRSARRAIETSHYRDQEHKPSRYDRKSRSPTHRRHSRSRSKSQAVSKQPSRSDRKSRSRSGSPSSNSRRKLSRKNDNPKSDPSVVRVEKLDMISEEMTPDKKQKTADKKKGSNVLNSEPKAQKENHYDPAVHKLMNKMRRTTDNKEPDVIKKELTDPKSSKNDKSDRSDKEDKSEKSEKIKQREKKSHKSDKHDETTKPAEKRSNSCLMATEEETVNELVLKPEADSLLLSDHETKKKKHKKSDKSDDKDSSSKHKKHKKSKKHKHKHKSSSKEKDLLVPQVIC